MFILSGGPKRVKELSNQMTKIAFKVQHYLCLCLHHHVISDVIHEWVFDVTALCVFLVDRFQKRPCYLVQPFL